MNVKNYDRKLEFQKNLISRQSKQIESLKKQNEKLSLELEKKDELINSVASMKEELSKNIEEHKRFRNEYQKLIDELRKMKEIVNQEVYKNRWWLIRFLLK